MYLGIDCGSTSVKLVAMDEKDDIIASIYLPNKGLKDTLLEGLEKIREQYKGKIDGVGVTGSGRHFTNVFLKADIMNTEIFAHVTATKHYFPKVRTVMDIGGEDSKLITLDKKGLWNHSIYNDVCGGGVGSMLVNIANNLDVKTEDIAGLALQSKKQLDFPSKCGVLINSAVITYKNNGVSKEDLLMGACRALIKNYMLLSTSIKLFPPYVFQGATAKNAALVKCFEDEIGEKINIPERPELMGAIGMALLCKANNINNEFTFDFSNKTYDVEAIIADGCKKECKLTMIYENGKKLGVIGNSCEKCGVN